ncbi:MAG: FAD-binding oxidoreductase [Actinomycetota bacterium]|nr:FAD-binding oxidoreductase [Actinomycetota bacterium]
MSQATERAELTLTGWGAGQGAHELPAAARKWLRREIGWTPRSTPAEELSSATTVATMLPDSTSAALIEIVGDEHVRTDGPSRLRRGSGRSYLDLIRRRGGDVSGLPDAVVLPGSHDEVLAVLERCSADDIAVVPFGGGTSVVGGLSGGAGGHRALITLDVARLNAIDSIDAKSLLVKAGPGLRAPEFEARMARYGLTLGHFPQSYEFATLGGYAATRSSGQASTGYGRFDELVAAARLATPAGTWDVGRAPASAAGPDLLGLVLGSEGTFGVITELTLRVRPAPEAKQYEGWSFRSWPRALEGLRQLARTNLLPDVVRLSDPDETRANLVLAGSSKASALQGLLRARGHGGGCLLILGWEGHAGAIGERRRAASSLLRRCEAIRVGRSVGQSWLSNRYSGPYVRDALLDVGLLVETLETAASWSDLQEVYEATRTALTESLSRADKHPLVMCHVSHVYPTGASLYFTVLADRNDDRPLQQWLLAKRAATDALVSRGGVITHHHAVGIDHAPWLSREIGDLGVAVLHAVKERLDPTGICNPCVLFGSP